MASEAPVDTAPVETTRSGKPKKPRLTFMLHDPKDMSCLSKYKSTEVRYAALKAASNGHTNILLRQTNSKEIRQYSGKVVMLDKPKEVRRGNDPTKPPIVYTKEPKVTFEKKWTYDDTHPSSPSVPLADV